MSELTKTLVIDDGTKEIEVKNKFGKPICTLYIRTADYSILDRYNAFVKDLSTIVAPLENIDIKPDGTTDEDEGIALLKAAEAEIVKRFNALFDMGDGADKLFATRAALSPVGGQFFCEVVLNALGELIRDAIEAETEKSIGRMNKFLSPDAQVKADDRGTTE